MIPRSLRSLGNQWRSWPSAYRWLAVAGVGIASSLCSRELLSHQTEAAGSGQAARWLLQVALPCLCVMCCGRAVATAPQSPAVVGASALGAALAAAAIDPDWDTVRLLFLVASAVAACATLILLLPAAWRRNAVSLLILFHFGGIFCAVMSAPPPGTTPSWITTQVWTRLFRPYLQFTYLNNAYHFYSPEPGPATLLWFRLESVDGSDHWIKIPDRNKDARDPLLIEYYRRLSLTENAAQLAPVPNIPAEIARKRAVASLVDAIPSPDEIALEAPGVLQYRPLTQNGKRFIESYVRHVAHRYAPDGRLENVKNVKVYRIVHTVIQPGILAAGMSPGDHSLYVPFFQGTFDAEGNLLNPQDPYLYWLIPVLKSNLAESGGSRPEAISAVQSLRNQGSDRDYLKIHAGSSPWEEQ
jgi:hypothetical protein